VEFPEPGGRLGSDAARGNSGGGRRRSNAGTSPGGRQLADLSDQRLGTGGQRALAHLVAHARQFIEAGLHDGVRMIVARHRAAVDLNHQSLEFMTQIAHGADARHAGAALQRMQLAL
jgi:hypothetical protein